MAMLERIVKLILMNANRHRVKTMENVYNDLILHFIHCLIEIHCQAFFQNNFHLKMQVDTNAVGHL